MREVEDGKWEKDRKGEHETKREKRRQQETKISVRESSCNQSHLQTETDKRGKQLKKKRI